MRRALIVGVSGQDGALLARFLIGKGYDVWGTSRDAETNEFANLCALGIRSEVNLVNMSPQDRDSVITLISDLMPHEIYYLAAQSSVALSFEQPQATFISATLGALNLVEAVRLHRLDARIYHASSSECFGDVGNKLATESTYFQPKSPYAVAKASAHWLVKNYREVYGLYASNGILFNHESSLRPPRYVTKKIVSAACRISLGSSEKLKLGRLDIVRDWGWAEEYVEAMWRILQHHSPDDIIIATGKSSSLSDFVEASFKEVGLEWQKYVETDPLFCRPTDISISRGDPSKASNLIGWEAKIVMEDVVKMMVEAELKALTKTVDSL